MYYWIVTAKMISEVLFLMFLQSFCADASSKKFNVEVAKSCKASKIMFSDLELNRGDTDTDGDLSGKIIITEDIIPPMIIQFDTTVCGDESGLPSSCKNVLTGEFELCERLPTSEWLKPIFENAKIPKCPLPKGNYSFSKQAVKLTLADRLVLEPLGNYCKSNFYKKGKGGENEFCLYFECSMKQIVKSRTHSFNAFDDK